MPDVLCPRCSRPVPPEKINTGLAFECQGCSGAVVLDVFPAAQRTTSAAAHGGVASEGEAVCFFHDHRAARAACDGCGRYVCALCDVPVGREHLCPECLALRSREGAQVFPSRRFRGDLLAVALVFAPLVPVFTFGFTIITAPAALALVFAMWRKPRSLVGWTRAWLIVAGVGASLEILGWLTFLVTAIVR